MKTYFLAISIILLSLAIIISGLFALTGFNSYLALAKQTEKDKAIDSCLSASSVEINDLAHNSKTTDPIRQTYQLCMNDKSYPTSLDNK